MVVGLDVVEGGVTEVVDEEVEVVEGIDDVDMVVDEVEEVIEGVV